ncbi:TPA: hypothetical protein N0H21_001310 [Pseudomonas aeruginosa]|nr:hypothetical protein [Pseudomonas aeruginosa]
MTYNQEFAELKKHIKCSFYRKPSYRCYQNGFSRYVIFTEFKENPLKELNIEVPKFKEWQERTYFEFSDYALRYFNGFLQRIKNRPLKVNRPTLFAIMVLAENHLYLKSREVKFTDETIALEELKDYFSNILMTDENIHKSIEKSALEIQNQWEEITKDTIARFFK